MAQSSQASAGATSVDDGAARFDAVMADLLDPAGGLSASGGNAKSFIEHARTATNMDDRMLVVQVVRHSGVGVLRTLVSQGLLALLGAWIEDANVAGQVKALKTLLKAVHLMPVTVDALTNKSDGLGKRIIKLGKHPDHEVAAHAKQIKIAWRGLAAVETSESGVGKATAGPSLLKC